MNNMCNNCRAVFREIRADFQEIVTRRISWGPCDVQGPTGSLARYTHICLYVCMFVVYIFVCMYVCDVRGPTGSDTRYICIYFLYTYVCDVRGPTGSAAR